MSRFYLLRYFVREAFISMTRNTLLNSIAIGMIAVSLAIFGIFLLIYVNLNSVVRRWSDAVQVIAYVDEQPSEDLRVQIDAKIRDIPNVEDVKYVSQVEAFEKFKQRLTGHEYLLNGIDDDFSLLPASFEIRLESRYQALEHVQNVVNTLQAMSHFDDIQYGQKWLENLTIVMNMLKFVGIFLGTFLFLTVIFIISNTIKLALYTRAEELNIMKFVGATESFIKGPFLAEGIIRGFLGAVTSIVLLVMIHQLFMMIIRYSASPLFLFSSISFLSWTAIISLILLGSFLGWCGSLLTLHKFLKTY